MERYVPMYIDQYLIVCCNSMDGLDFVERYKTKSEAENKLKEYYEKENRDPDNSEVSFTGTEVHVITNEWQDDIWYELVKIKAAV